MLHRFTYFLLPFIYSISYLVVDEVDRFMHGNMEEQLRNIFAVVTSSLRPRQTLLFSATLPENLERLARSAVLDPVSTLKFDTVQNYMYT